MTRPNILFIMTDQQRFDTIAALGNSHIYTPNMDRLVQRGVSFTRAYSTTPVCMAARYTIRTGCEPDKTRAFSNGWVRPVPGQAETVEGRCGPYLARTLKNLGYRTFGVGKFHTNPRFEDIGYETHLHSEELYGTVETRQRDAYASFLMREHPAFDFVEQVHGERTEMYYMPQVSPLPARLTVEAWAADRAVEQLAIQDDRPYFGFVSFVGPHPPFAPPVPFNRLYDPDRMPDAVRGDLAIDHMDEQIPWMNHIIWAEDINDPHNRVLKSRYYGELTYIDWCLGRVLDAVEKRGDADNTLICFFTDHGDHLGDHHAWQKESYFEASCHVPYLVSWPAKLPSNVRREEIVCLTDLFAIATGAAGALETRDGMDVLGMLNGKVAPREHLVAMYSTPGTDRFKVMVRSGDWKYVYIANGDREQLFNVTSDPNELRQLAHEEPDVATRLRAVAAQRLRGPAVSMALENDDLRGFPYTQWPRRRIHQMAGDRGAAKFPDHPREVIESFDFERFG